MCYPCLDKGLVDGLGPFVLQDFHELEVGAPTQHVEKPHVLARALARGEKSAVIGKKLKEQEEKKEQDSPYLHPELRRELYRVHRNLGHPNLARFLRALKHAGAKTEVLEWTKSSFKCPICEQNQKKSSYRPAHLQRSLNFIFFTISRFDVLLKRMFNLHVLEVVFRN